MGDFFPLLLSYSKSAIFTKKEKIFIFSKKSHLSLTFLPLIQCRHMTIKVNYMDDFVYSSDIDCYLVIKLKSKKLII